MTGTTYIVRSDSKTINAKDTFARMANKVRAFASAVKETLAPSQEYCYSFAA